MKKLKNKKKIMLGKICIQKQNKVLLSTVWTSHIDHLHNVLQILHNSHFLSNLLNIRFSSLRKRKNILFCLFYSWPIHKKIRSNMTCIHTRNALSGFVCTNWNLFLQQIIYMKRQMQKIDIEDQTCQAFYTLRNSNAFPSTKPNRTNI